MDASFEHIHAKVAELETKIADLRIAERELLALDESSARQTKTVSTSTPRDKKPGPKAAVQQKLRGKPKASEPAKARQTIGAAIAERVKATSSEAGAPKAPEIEKVA
jgi:hypothetical protein